MLARTRKALEEKEQGFTLIELLVVIVIIGILAAIAVPTFLNQREKAWARAAQSDVRNAAVQVEEFYNENGTYVGAQNIDFLESEAVQHVWLHAYNPTQYCVHARSKYLKGEYGNPDSTYWSFKNYGEGSGTPGAAPC